MRGTKLTSTLLAAAIAAILVPSARAAAQAAAGSQPRPTFEVASVKPSDPAAPPGRSFAGIPSGGGRFQSLNTTLRSLIRYAYLVLPGTQLVGVPNWFDTERFDINAKAAGDPPRGGSSLLMPNAYQLMLQSLLEERFGLILHRETREGPAYALVLAKNDGKLGPNLHPSIGKCAPGPPQPGSRDCPQGLKSGSLTMSDLDLSWFALVLTQLGDRPVIDRTGLKGTYDITLTWTPPPPSALDDATGTSLFTALTEQLGLKLESTKAPGDVLVIDSVHSLVVN